MIITHDNPDGDAIGSSLGLYQFFCREGHNVNVVTPNMYPEFLHWLPGNEKVIIFSEQKDYAVKLIKEAEIIFNLDFNEFNRIRKIEPYVKKVKAVKVLIDHHPVKESFADYIISDISVSSTAELIFKFIINLGKKNCIDKSIAECLFTGIMADTGCFSFNSSQEDTFRIVSELLTYGIEKDKIYRNLYDNFSEDRMKLLGYCLNKKMVVIPDYRTAYLSLTKDELKQYNFKIGDTEGFVNFPLSIKDIIFSALFIEKTNHVKISFRSKGTFKVNKFSENNFNGGGHKNAAGGESNLNLEKTINKFIDLLPEYIKYLKE